jgi:hypothetical protein
VLPLLVETLGGWQSRKRAWQRAVGGAGVAAAAGGAGKRAEGAEARAVAAVALQA